MTRLAIALGLAAIVSFPVHASAHGRQPALGQIAFDPVDPDHVVVRASWGLLSTHDDAASFTWTCASVVDFDRLIEDPRIAVLGSGRVLAGTFDGLSRSQPDACGWTLVTDPLVDRLLVIDVAVDPHDPHGAWVATSPGNRANTIVYSADEGATFELRATFAMGVLLERVVPSPSDAMRVYASGVALETATEPRHAYVWRSTDGGRTFAPTEISLIDVDRSDYGERNVEVDFVDPTNADVVYAHTVRRATDTMPERLLRSDDGGLVFTAVTSMPALSATISEDGARVWVGSALGGLSRADDRGLTFATLDPTLAVDCLSYRPGELWLCTNDVAGPFALGRSRDLGVTVDPLWTFHDAVEDTGCGACSSVGLACQNDWIDVRVDLGLFSTSDTGVPIDAAVGASCIDAGPVDAGMDAGAGPPPVARCGCRAGSRGEGGIGIVLVALFVLGLRRRQRSVRN